MEKNDFTFFFDFIIYFYTENEKRVGRVGLLTCYMQSTSEYNQGCGLSGTVLTQKGKNGNIQFIARAVFKSICLLPSIVTVWKKAWKLTCFIVFTVNEKNSDEGLFSKTEVKMLNSLLYKNKITNSSMNSDYIACTLQSTLWVSLWERTECNLLCSILWPYILWSLTIFQCQIKKSKTHTHLQLIRWK